MKANVMLLKKAHKKLEKASKTWLRETQKITPWGYTRNLKKSLIVEKTDDGIKMVSDSPYAQKQQLTPLRHVSKPEVGRRSFMHYAGISRGSPRSKYFRGYRRALNLGLYETYTHNYPHAGWELAHKEFTT